ncbi:MAG TPA: inositol monophosphatase family protein [Solirubrobacteraceae bacterium]|jgi:myo-inositol-1(or 4)-monophosphatase
MSETTQPASDVEALLDIAIRATRGAGELLKQRFLLGEELAITSKSTPTDLVSEADLSAQREIRALLSRERPDDGFLGEEQGEDHQGNSGLRWVVDPLDGTINFLFGIPQWCVSVAVEDAEGPLAGAIFDPNRDELFTAVRNGPGRLNGGAPLEPSPRGELPTAMVATGFAYDSTVRAAQAKVLERLIPQIRDVRRFGSAALDLAWTAAGRYDAYFERSVKAWDIAAGTLICRCAGLSILELSPRPDLPWGILAGPAGLAEQLHELVDRS